MAAQVKDITRILERIAPPSLQESYDNSGLLVGNPTDAVSKVLISLDATEAVVDEAIASGANMVVSHHPILFGGIKRLNGNTYVERVLMKAIKNDIALYAIHTNLDNVLNQGVNQKIAQKLGLDGLRILKPMKGRLKKLVCFCPSKQVDQVRDAMFGAGAGHIGNYDRCSFLQEGQGTFRPGEGTDPYSGKIGEESKDAEVRIEVILPDFTVSQVVGAMKSAHPYEEVAYDVYPLENTWDQIGAGVVGELPEEMAQQSFLKHLKDRMDLKVIKHTSTSKEKIKKVALCGGSGSFLLNDAMKAGADVFITADYKYHQFFDGEDKTMICDIGHYESERFTIELLGDILKRESMSEKIANFAVILTTTDTNPVQYYY